MGKVGARTRESVAVERNLVFLVSPITRWLGATRPHWWLSRDRVGYLKVQSYTECRAGTTCGLLGHKSCVIAHSVAEDEVDVEYGRW
jgi:hypothetical protein